MTEGVREAVLDVTARIREAATQGGRDSDDIRLIAASKTVTSHRIEEAIAAGVKSFGENRVQEAADKWPRLRDEYPGVEVHLIGPLQSNKVATAVELFDVIQSLDRPKLAAELARCRARGSLLPRLLVQVNIGEEPQKAGLPPTGIEAFLDLCREDYGLDVEGLMCIPPAHEDPGAHFSALAALRERFGLAHCSMGMSGDYQEAIQHGATMVRVGSGLFGRRPQWQSL